MVLVIGLSSCAKEFLVVGVVILLVAIGLLFDCGRHGFVRDALLEALLVVVVKSGLRIAQSNNGQSELRFSM